MSFENPLGLLWGLLAAVIVAMYIRKERGRRVVTATSMFWNQAMAQAPHGQAWQRWQRHISLAVQLLILACIVLALANPQIPAIRSFALIVDGNTSTQAPPPWHPVVESLIDNLRPSDQMGIIFDSGTVGVRCNLTDDKATLHQAIAAWPDTHALVSRNAPDSGMPRGIAVAQRMLAEEAHGTILGVGLDGSVVVLESTDKSRGSKRDLTLSDLSRGMSPWPLLLSLAIAFLAAEWYAYHQRWSC